MTASFKIKSKTYLQYKTLEILLEKLSPSRASSQVPSVHEEGMITSHNLHLAHLYVLLNVI
jgi:hypothetical protein